ncbi:MAG: PTS transporter subunit EIIC [Streptococcaceae bacterium]|jgi:PTS system cellobiose-specific IIC component|nr:PTS transporter subunit EIIC [Streptococcaceae bacterium]
MSNFFNALSSKMIPLGIAMGEQRHLKSIKNGLISIMPLTIIGSFFTVIINLPIPGWADTVGPYMRAFDVPFRFTVGIMSLYAAFTIGASLAQEYKLEQKTAGFLSMLGTILMVMPVQISGVLDAAGQLISDAQIVDTAGNVVASGTRFLPIAQLGSSGLFGAMLASIITVEIIRFCKIHKLEVKMPDGVPPVIAQSFSALLPTFFVIMLFWVPRHFFGININEILTTIMSPLRGFLTGNNIFGGILTQLIFSMFWILGIHGPQVMGPIIRPFWETAILENSEAFANGVSAFHLPNIFTEQFFQWYAQMGGSGATLALVVMFLFSKSKYLKQLGRLSIIPGIFNINEPVTFGAPIVMNPVLAIPFVLAPVANTILIYVVTITGLMPRMMMRPPFSIPAPIGALMTTNFNWVAFAMVFVSFALSFAIYFPFFKSFEKMQLAEEAKNEAEKMNNKDSEDVSLFDTVNAK